MKKVSTQFAGLFLILLSVFGAWQAKAQVASTYTFSQTAGTYTPITGGTVYLSGTFDDGNSGAITIPSFTYDGNAYTSLGINANGHIAFGTYTSTGNYTPISSATNATGGIISAFGADLNNAASGSPEIRYELVGNEFVVQFQDVRRYGIAGEIISFQIRLNTLTNVIQVVYGGTIAPGNNTAYPQVGLKGPTNAIATNVNNRRIAAAGGSWINSIQGTANNHIMYFRSANAGTVPASGLTFTWTPPSCAAPAVTAATALTSTSATLNWNAASPAPSGGYQWEVRTSGAAGSGATGLQASGSVAAGVLTANVTGLTANTTYSIYVRSDCGSSVFSSWSSAVTFTTPCAAEAAPTAVQTFATFTGSAPNPICWSESSTLFSGTVSANTANSEWLSSTGFANTGTNVGVRTNLYGTDSDDWIISQPIDLGVTPGLYRVSYRMAVTTYLGTGAVATLGTHVVKVVISTDGGSTWAAANVLRTYTGVATYSNTGATETIDLTGYSGVVRVAFIATTASTSPDIDFHLDDFVVEAIPSCLTPTVTAPTSVTGTTATINWTAPSPAPSAGYEYVVSTSNVTPSTAANTGTDESGTSAAITGLSSNTTYYVFVRSDCGGSGYSTWSTAYSFTTPAACGDVVSGLCYNQTSSLQVMLNFSVSTPGDYATLTFLAGGVETCCDEVVVYDGLNATGNILYGALTGGGLADYSGVSTITSTTGNISFAINSDVSGTCNSSGYTPFSVQLNCVAPPACEVPTIVASTNILATTATINWTAPTNAPSGGYQWEVRTDLTPGIAGAVASGSTAAGVVTANVTGLTVNTSYNVYVRSFCGGSSYSAWAGPYALVTNNDDCGGAYAFPIIPTNGNCATVTVNNTGYTQSLAGCSGTADDDQWFTFVVPAGNTSVNYSTTNISGSTDRMFQLFSACGGTSLFCNDPESGTWTGLVAGNTYVLRTYSFFNASATSFDLCLSVPPPPPANDECAAAIAFPTIPSDGTCASVTVNTASATQSLAACTGSGANDDVWFSFVMPAGQTTVNFSVTNTISGSADRVFQFFDACGGTSLLCSDPESGSVTGLTPGNTYWVRAHTYSSTTSIVSNFDFCLSVPPPAPANDECAAAIAFPTIPSDGTCASVTVNTASATESLAACAGTGANDDVWFSFVMPAGETTINFSVTNTISGSTDRVFQFFDACGGTSLLCSDPESGSVTGLTPGNTYLVRTHTYSSTTSTVSNFEFCLNVPPPPPANDDCAGVVALTVDAPSVSGTANGATPMTGGTLNDVWFSFTPTCSGVHTVTTNGYGFPADYDLGIYTLCPGTFTTTNPPLIGTGTSFSTSSETASATVVAGTTYYVMVQDWDGLGGTFNIQVTSPTPALVLSNTGTPAAGNIGQSSNNVVISGFQLAPGCVSASLTSVTYTTTGTATTADLSNFRIYQDVNANGTYEVGTDLLASTAAQALAASMTFGIAGQTGISTNRRYLLVADVSGTATVGRTITARITPVGNIAVTTTPVVTPTGTALGNLRTISGVPPANDNCSTATPFPVIPTNQTCATLSNQTTLNGTNSGVTPTGSCTSNSGNPDDDVWFSFVAPETALSIEFTYVAGSTDIYWQVFSSACASSMTSIVCSDDNAGSILYGLTPGNTYYLRMYTWAGSGAFSQQDICIKTLPPAPANDECANAISLPCGTSGLAGTTEWSRPEPAFVSGAIGMCSMGQFGVWYTFVGNGYSTTVTCDATFDIELSITRGTCGALSNVNCIDDAGGSESATFTTVLGTRYYVYISYWLSGSTTTGTFTISRTCGVNEWTGSAVANDWATNGNWSEGTVPASNGVAFIPTTPVGGNFPIIDEAASIATLTLATGSSVSIQGGHSLSVTGVLTNNGTINVASGGSLVQATGSTRVGTGIYNVTRNGSTVFDFWSSPITTVSTNIFGQAYAYDPQLSTADPFDDLHDPGWVAPGATMIPGKGYAAFASTVETFTGTVNNGNVSIPVQYFNNPDPMLPGVPFNLVGNPYPSGIDAATFLSANSGILSVNSIYLWDSPATTPYDSQDFAVWNPTLQTAGGGGNTPGPVIGSAQGFEVRVNGAGSVQFTNAMRVAGNTNMLFRQSDAKKLWLSAVNAEGRYNQMAIGFLEDGTDGPDWSYDTPKINLGSGHSFYSLMDDNTPYVTQAYGSLFPDRIVPLGYISNTQSMVTISLDTNFNMESDIIYLEDRHLNVFQDLHEGSYVFQTNAVTYNDRFFLHFATPSVTGMYDVQMNPMHAFINNDMLTVSKANVEMAALEIFDMSGRMVWTSGSVGFSNGLAKVDVSSLSMGVYVVRMIANGEISSQKVIK
ncbi:MAG: T9SS type A sorting domain-containing protein [Flavobacteriales bacterium]|nr:T9SS type A sorting domain-containing protein [Flavobacteriales bacterium]